MFFQHRILTPYSLILYTYSMPKLKKIIVANWKMNPANFDEAKKIFSGVKKVATKLLNVQTVVCPPFIYLDDFVPLCKGTKIAIGAQDAFSKNKGSFTGMISPEMLKVNGVKYVILGHSERRALGESDEFINNKIRMSLKTGLNVIFCVGEKERSDEGWHFAYVKDQILNGLEKIGKSDLENILIAYEPVWAISTNGDAQVMSSADVHEMKIFIKKVLVDKYGINAKLPKVLYGGSVDEKNTEELFLNGGVDGLLVGKASLSAEKFGEILKIANSL